MSSACWGYFFFFYFVLWVSVEAGLPNITGTFTGGENPPDSYATGSFRSTGTNDSEKLDGGSYSRCIITLNASLSNLIYSKSSTVTPLSRSTLMLIKY